MQGFVREKYLSHQKIWCDVNHVEKNSLIIYLFASFMYSIFYEYKMKAEFVEKGDDLVFVIFFPSQIWKIFKIF